MLRYGAGEWRRLPWWQRQAYLNGIRWEFDRHGLFPAVEFLKQGDAKGGGGDGQFVPLNSLADRAAEGIQTGIIYQ